MNDNLKLSIIIPAYNCEKTIGKCLDSWLNQSYENLEIIVINDGSTDKTEEICAFYKNKDERIALVNQKNGGVSSARNHGLSISSGEIIGFCDADDFVDLEIAQSIMPLFRKNGGGG